MAKKSKRRCDTLRVLHPDAAGIDVGAIELYVAVSADRRKPPNVVFKSSPRRTGDVPWEHATGITRQGYREPWKFVPSVSWSDHFGSQVF
jgi:hypothetical protein